MNTTLFLVAESDFTRARARARNSQLLARLSGRSSDLPSFEEARRLARPHAECYLGCRQVPVERIVGSEGRNKDFCLSFLPRHEFLRPRWERVDSAYHEGRILPPVSLLELGGTYFVRDGNHRVSVARAHRVEFIDAEVTRLVPSVVPEPPAAVQTTHSLLTRDLSPGGDAA